MSHQLNREFKIKDAFETHSLDYKTHASKGTNCSGEPLL